MGKTSIESFRIHGRVEVDPRAAHKSLKATEADAKSVATAFKGLKGEIGTLSGSLKGFGNGGGSAFLGGAAGGAAIGALKSGVSVLFGQVRGLVDEGMQFADVMQQSNISFTTLLGNQVKAKAHLKEMVAFGGKTPFETRDLLQYSQQLQSVGVDAAKIQEYLSGIGDAASRAGNFDKMQNAVAAVVQMLGKGKISAEEMRQQLSEAVPGAMGYMARSQGITEAELDKRMTAGTLNAKAAVELMILQMKKEAGGTMLKVAGSTIAGLASTKKDTRAIAAARAVMGGDITEGPQAGSIYAEQLKRMQHQIDAISSFNGGQFEQTIARTGGRILKAEAWMEDELMKPAAGTETVEKFYSSLVDGTALGRAKEAVGNIVGTVTNTIKGGVGSAAAAAGDLGGAIEKGLDDVWEFGSPSRKAIRLGKWISEGLEIGLRKHGRNYKALVEAATKGGFDITSTTGGKHGRNSAHGPGQAVDIRTKNKTAEEVETLINTLRSQGVYVIDERNKPNQPHVHAQFGTQGIKAGAAHLYGGERFTGQAQSTVASALSSLDQIIAENSRRTGIPENVIRGLIMTESSGRAGVVSSKGAVGLMQVKPSTAAAYIGGGNLKDPATNIYAGTSYLIDLLKQYSGDMRAALQAYNVGPGNYAKGMRNSYPDKVLGASAQFTTQNPMPVAIVGAGAGLAFSAGRPPTPARDAAGQQVSASRDAASIARGLRVVSMLRGATANLQLTTQNGFGILTELSSKYLPETPKAIEELTKGDEARRQELMKIVNNTGKIGETISTRLMGALGQGTGQIPGQQVGRKRGFFSKLLGIASPFLGMIPGVGPLLSTLANIGSSAVGGDYAGAIMGAAGGFASGGAFRRTGGISSASSVTGTTTRIGGVNMINPGVATGAVTTTGNTISTNLSGARAMGGPVSRGRAYLVGENRAEVFTPNADGWIHPDASRYGGRGGQAAGGSNIWARLEAFLQQNLETAKQNLEVSQLVHGKFNAMSPGDVVVKGAATYPHAIGAANQRSMELDPKRVEWMQRRVNGQ
jgi:tape measure domain-containing protein